MVINGQALIDLAPIKSMYNYKAKKHGTSFGLSEAGYDIRIKQDIHFKNTEKGMMIWTCTPPMKGGPIDIGTFTLASAIEEFQMPTNLVGIVHDKSTWARQGLSVFNTVIEPGFKGGLTLELVYHGSKDLHIPTGSGIAQVIFHQLSNEASYDGKYQGQSTDPVPSRFT